VDARLGQLEGDAIAGLEGEGIRLGRGGLDSLVDGGARADAVTDTEVEGGSIAATGGEGKRGGRLIAMLQPTKWLAGLPLGACMQKGDVAVEGNTVRIDDRAKGDCSGAEELVKRTIKTSGDLRKQED
jgi:hypothetical protein